LKSPSSNELVVVLLPIDGTSIRGGELLAFEKAARRVEEKPEDAPFNVFKVARLTKPQDGGGKKYHGAGASLLSALVDVVGGVPIIMV
jgi:hypothetical protein